MKHFSEFIRHLEEKESLNERHMVRRIRKGKLQRKLSCDTQGYKNVGNRCVRMSSQEKLHRRMGMRKAVRTKKARKARQRRSNFQRQRSMLRRKAMGLH